MNKFNYNNTRVFCLFACNFKDMANFNAPAVQPDQITYVAPSPQVTQDGLLVSFFVRDVGAVSHGSLATTRHGRYDTKDQQSMINNPPVAYLPAAWVVPALLLKQQTLAAAVSQIYIPPLKVSIVIHHTFKCR